MPRLERATRRRLRVPAGDLSERIFIEDRELPAPAYGSMASDFKFTPHKNESEVWANVETVSGVTYFDEVAGLDRSISHKIVIRYLTGITPETWIRLTDGSRLDIVTTDPIDARDEFLQIQAAFAGDKAKQGAGL